ncbi:cryptochrome/photolyase family protein [Halolamina salifodinae]|uniref:Deoxyribodipyrimidine photo-lyase n=1 Tax=Halolamina salifodinae TaxID=1202767 RepID=A0A8T4GRC2_9EURY|nr:deoxyribodipyrimidine photo-lyase [Halolamina salifodinae]MBP1985597.1 deoxyribodipyrimidine photo-lyase [Halolamina salifodinae]
MTLFWHRRDVRASDNRGLAAAADEGDAVPVFVFDDEVLEHGNDARVRFLLDSLAELRETYRERGSDLVLARGDPAAVIPALATAVDVEEGTPSGSQTSSDDADRAHWNRDYTKLSRERDARVRLALERAGVARESHHDSQLHEPGTIRTNQGDPYSVYTYFWKKWRDREKPDPFPTPDAGLADREDLTPTALVDAADAADSDGEAEAAHVLDDALLADLPTIDDLGFEEPEADVEPAGTAAARERLDSFCEEPIFHYDEDRDYPAKEGSSRLSGHLKFGTIGLREVYAATESAMREARSRDEGSEGSEAQDNVETFQSQLAWREFYTQVLYFNPDVVTENYKEYEQPIDWRDDADELAAWKAGETGYPIVDAGMRQLRAEAWMHNRLRMIVASFLTKDLLWDWRAGYEHFREFLADHDTANDNGGWQWAASTGTDAQPYFRIFNPTTQGERYDPDAEYIREYVPELRGVDAETIHDWPELSDEERAEAAPEYPHPIVAHGARREQALAMYKRARGEDPEEN